MISRLYPLLKLAMHSFLLVDIANISAQSISDSVVNQINKPISIFYEKVYIHTDRDYYVAGDNIWFKAYLFDAQSNIPAVTSNNLYVELMSPSSHISTKIVRLNNGTGNGSFTLSDTSATGIWRIRAYTSWMQNFKNNFVFEKKLHIIAEKKSENIRNPITNNDYIGFFPESGPLIQGVRSLVAFKAYDKNGEGLSVHGYIVSSKNDTICRAKSSHLGMGKFRLCPDKGEIYYFKGFINNVLYKAQLPLSQNEGYVLEISPNDSAYLSVVIKTNSATLDTQKKQKIILSFSHQHKIFFIAETNIDALQTSLKFLKKIFPEGITSITLYDKNIVPKAERLFFTEKKDTNRLTLRCNKSQYAPRDKIELSINHATDTISSIEEASLSLSVTDAGFIPDGISNIKSYMYLESELKGKIENPKSYFDTTNKERHKQLDLLLLTQGWRNYIWCEIKDSAYSIRYPMEKGFTLNGIIKHKFNNNPLDKAYLTLLLPQDSLYKIYSSRSDSLGRFCFKGLKIYGKQFVKLSLLDKKRKKRGCLQVAKPFEHLPIPISPEYVYVNSKPDTLLVKIAAERRKIRKNYRLSDTIPLTEVTVKDYRIRRINNSMQVSHPIKVYDLLVKPEDSLYYNLKYYILKNIPEASTRGQFYYQTMYDNPINGINYQLIDNPSTCNLMFDSPNAGSFFVMYINDSPGISKSETGKIDKEKYDHYLSLPMGSVNKVIVRKYWMPDLDSKSVKQFYYYLISLTLKPEAFNSCSSYSTIINGYSIERVFYSPAYDVNPNISKLDLRSTIYWNPKIEIVKSKKVQVSFYASDVKGTFRVDLQGLTKNGMPITQQIFYKVE